MSGKESAHNQWANAAWREWGTVGEVIGYLSGVALDAETIDVGGVGYHVQTPKPMVGGVAYELHVSTIVRDDSITLYGFSTKEERKFFAALMRVSGVGATSALSLLGELGPERIADAIDSQDAASLSCVKGIGAKTAKAIATLAVVPEEYLRRRASGGAATAAHELTVALISLGLDRSAAQRAVSQAQQENPDADEAALLGVALLIAKASA